MDSKDSIFLIGHDGAQLERIPLRGYAREDMLQDLIAQYPEVLMGEQIDPDDPPRWLLVTREAGIPDTENASGRWSADHLLIDQFALPTIVEVKRAEDTRIRREVVGQMLEYAANATRYWPAGRIRELAARQHGGPESLSVRVLELIGDAQDADPVDAVEQYWTDLDSNLKKGRLRLIFVADELPRELRRMIEYLNEHMRDVDVLGVELRQYVGASVRALVPRVVGLTERARDQRETTRPRRTSSEQFLGSCPGISRVLFEEILSRAGDEGLDVNWGTKGFSVRGSDATGRRVALLYGYPAGAMGSELPLVQVYLKDIAGSTYDDAIRSMAKDLPSFGGQGKYTLTCFISDRGAGELRQLLPTLWDTYRSIRAQDGDGQSERSVRTHFS